MKKSRSKSKGKSDGYKINTYQNETNYSIKLLIVEGKLQISIKASKNFSEDIHEFSNTYSFKQLQIVNKYFSSFNSIDQAASDLNNLIKSKVNIEEDKDKDKSLILKIPTTNEKSSGDIIFKIMKTRKLKKIKHSDDKLKGKNDKGINIYDSNINNIKNFNDNKDSGLLLGNINELVKRVKHLEKKEAEKDKEINKLKEDISNYQEKIDNSINYPIYTPLANKNINLIDDKNNNISQIIKQRNAEEDDDNLDMNLETEKSLKNNNKKEKDKKNNSKNKNKKEINDDSDSSEENSEKDKKNKSNGKNNSDEEKQKNDLIQKEQLKLLYSSQISGFPIIERENIKDYINSRIFYTIREMQMVKYKITNGKKNIHAYFDLLYRASVDGDYEETINSLCEGAYPQITLFLTKEGARFGVYIDKEKSTSFFKKGTIYKEKPGTSFLFSLNSLKTYQIQEGEIATDNRTEKLCFGRTFRYNNNESNWLIYVPRNEFLGVDLLFGDKESSFGEINNNEIIGYVNNYHLKDVEIFKVLIEKDGNGMIDENDEDNEYKNIDDEKEEKFEKKKNEKNKKNNNNDDTFDGKSDEENGKGDNRKKKKKNNSEDEDDESD